MTVSCGSVVVVAIGNISVSSTPTVARIWLAPHSGSYANTGIDTNNTISSLPIGDYDIKLVKSGYQDYIASLITVTSGGTATVNAMLTLSTGSVSFTSTPSGAEVFVDSTDQLITTPSGTITGLTPGSNNHTYKLTTSGYTDATGTFSISPGANTAIPVTFAGSALITSTPTGAEVYLAPSPDTAIDQGYITDRTFTGMTDASSGATTTWNYKLTKAGYTDNTGSFLATAGGTVGVSKTLLTVMHIVATGITVIPSNPCIEGTCSVTVNVTWINMGETAGLHDLSITVGGGTSTITPSAYSSVAFDAHGTEGDTVTRIFTVTGLDNAHSPHLICPNPNT
jgi:hypothetical protein